MVGVLVFVLFFSLSSAGPTQMPSAKPTRQPSLMPTPKPTKAPSNAPTRPTSNPSRFPTSTPTNPTAAPSFTPTLMPSLTPTGLPSSTDQPTAAPSEAQETSGGTPPPEPVSPAVVGILVGALAGATVLFLTCCYLARRRCVLKRQIENMERLEDSYSSNEPESPSEGHTQGPQTPVNLTVRKTQNRPPPIPSQDVPLTPALRPDPNGSPRTKVEPPSPRRQPTEDLAIMLADSKRRGEQSHPGLDRLSTAAVVESMMADLETGSFARVQAEEAAAHEADGEPTE